MSVLAPLSALGQQRDADAIQLDPVGTWRCVVYGHPAFGDERMLLSFAPDQSSRLARSTDGGAPTWSPLSRWQVENGLMSFADTRTGRRPMPRRVRASTSWPRSVSRKSSTRSA